MISAPDAREPWQTPSIEAVTETDARGEGTTASIRNGANPSIPI